MKLLRTSFGRNGWILVLVVVLSLLRQVVTLPHGALNPPRRHPLYKRAGSPSGPSSSAPDSEIHEVTPSPSDSEGGARTLRSHLVEAAEAEGRTSPFAETTVRESPQGGDLYPPPSTATASNPSRWTAANEWLRQKQAAIRQQALDAKARFSLWGQTQLVSARDRFNRLRNKFAGSGNAAGTAAPSTAQPNPDPDHVSVPIHDSDGPQAAPESFRLANIRNRLAQLGDRWGFTAPKSYGPEIHSIPEQETPEYQQRFAESSRTAGPRNRLERGSWLSSDGIVRATPEDWERLTPEQKQQYRLALTHFEAFSSGMTPDEYLADKAEQEWMEQERKERARLQAESMRSSSDEIETESEHGSEGMGESLSHGSGSLGQPSQIAPVQPTASTTRFGALSSWYANLRNRFTQLGAIRSAISSPRTYGTEIFTHVPGQLTPAASSANSASPPPLTSTTGEELRSTEAGPSLTGGEAPLDEDTEGSFQAKHHGMDPETYNRFLAQIRKNSGIDAGEAGSGHVPSSGTHVESEEEPLSRTKNSERLPAQSSAESLKGKGIALSDTGFSADPSLQNPPGSQNRYEHVYAVQTSPAGPGFGRPAPLQIPKPDLTGWQNPTSIGGGPSPSSLEKTPPMSAGAESHGRLSSTAGSGPWDDFSGQSEAESETMRPPGVSSPATFYSARSDPLSDPRSAAVSAEPSSLRPASTSITALRRLPLPEFYTPRSSVSRQSRLQAISVSGSETGDPSQLEPINTRKRPLVPGDPLRLTRIGAGSSSGETIPESLQRAPFRTYRPTTSRLSQVAEGSGPIEGVLDTLGEGVKTLQHEVPRLERRRVQSSAWSAKQRRVMEAWKQAFHQEAIPLEWPGYKFRVAEASNGRLMFYHIKPEYPEDHDVKTWNQLSPYVRDSLNRLFPYVELVDAGIEEPAYSNFVVRPDGQIDDQHLYPDPFNTPEILRVARLNGVLTAMRLQPDSGAEIGFERVVNMDFAKRDWVLQQIDNLQRQIPNIVHSGHTF
ncbi:hypothetical protein BCV70DRAFT_230603 [Testicularia cyperi]|uniref:Uncharacterized protein n=1 Tax=Testicularia cyperi TaxID=1882483 RepID=A0A317XVP6_9BASI|nr:hypothetical protein BCV70DRAFT_230603 [Testicularia cyperi]